MSKYVKKIFAMMFSLSAIMLLLMTVVSCQQGITKKDLEALKFEDSIVDYDGENHSIYVDNIYEDKGVTVSYMNNNKKTPGNYTVTAIIRYNELSVNKTAKLTINKIKSVLTADLEQSVYLYGGKLMPEYSLDNDVQKVTLKYFKDGVEITENDLYSEGQYVIEAYAPATTLYSESNHLEIKFNVVKSKYNVKFESTEYVADGSEKKIELVGTLPEGYTVAYENNAGVDAGDYFAVAYIKDSSGNVVEKHTAVLEINNPENEEFNKFLDDFFVEYLEGDQLSVNIFCENPEDFGLSHYDATWYTYSSSSDFNAELEETLVYFNGLLDELHKFENDKLSDLQMVAYRNVDSFLNYYLDYYNISDSTFMNIVYVDQFGGYVADFGTYMEAYSLRSEVEVQDVVDYIKSTKEAFPSYLDFVAEKAEKGYALSDYTITEMRKYLSDILEDSSSYYLSDVLCEKIAAVDFLSAEQKTAYSNEIVNSFNEYFIPGVQELYDGLEKYLGLLSEENEGYWSKYENGKKMYILELERLLGIENIDINSYILELDKTIEEASSKAIAAQKSILNSYNIGSWDQFMRVINDNPIYDGTPDEMMVYLKEFAKTIVPELQSEPDIVIKEMDEASAKVSNAVAYYMKSALDNTAKEYITLNPVKLGGDDKNDVIGTLSHEGYPGHLYAYVYSKELDLHNLSKIMTNTAHGEGWATYVELKLYDYAKANSSDFGYKQVMNYLYANQLSGFLLETRLDVGIHYQNWGIKEMGDYLDKLGYNSGAAEELYNLLIEMPTGYAAYGYGKLVFYNLHQEAQSILAGFYDEVEFNEMLLSKGWTGLTELKNTYNEYMTKKCHELGISYN